MQGNIQETIMSNNSNKPNKHNYTLISAILIRILSIVAFFTIYSFFNNIVISIAMIFAMLIPFIGGAFCHFFLLTTPFISAFSPNYELTKSIILLIIFVLYIPCLVCFLYNVFLYKFDSRKKIVLIMSIILSIAALFLVGMQFNKANQITSNVVSSTSLKLNNKSSRVSPGENAHISVTGKPNTEYSIIVDYPSGYSEAEGLYNKTSDSNGVVSWTWEVGTRTTPGTYPITITDLSTYDFNTYYFTVE